MKRYMLFKGRDFYPQGGMDDFIADYTNEEETISEAKKLVHWESDWSQVYDAEKRELIARFRIIDGESVLVDELSLPLSFEPGRSAPPVAGA